MTEPHLDDQTLSATIDGESWPDHLAGCPDCMARRRRLAEAAARIAAPVTPAPDTVREQALRAAAAVVTPRRSPSPGRILAVAAAIVLVLGLGVTPLLFRGGSRPAETASPPIDDKAATVAGPDLGVVDDAPTLDMRLRAALGPSVPSQASPAAPGDQAETQAQDDRVSGGEFSSAAGAPGGQPCEKQARRAGAKGAALVLSASLTWQGQPAYVFVLSDPGAERLSRRAVVLSRSGCSILVVQSF